MTVLILHGSWLGLGVGDANGPTNDSQGGAFFVWAERVPAGRRGRRPTGGPKAGAPHPFQARPEEVRDALIALSPVLARQSERTIWRLARQQVRLPSREGGPLHSPEAARVVAALGDDGGAEERGGASGQLGETGEEANLSPAPPLPSPSAAAEALVAWQVRGVALEPVRAAELLASLPLDGRVESDSIVLAADMRYWSACAKLVVELLARQRFVPSLERNEPAPPAGGAVRSGGRPAGQPFEVRWRPVLDDQRDAERLALLASSQPPIARAAIMGDGEAATARGLVESFVEAALDGLARAWLAAEGARRSAGPSPTAGRAWLEALRRGERTVRASAFDVERLATRLAEWRAPLVTSASSSAYRTCFRLEPPGGDGEKGGWTLRIFLQAVDDPSLLLPAERIWREQGGTTVYLNRRFDQPQERLLADLGLAARSFPPLDHCLGEARPSVCALTPEEAYEFLREGAWLLEEQGFGVLVPSWWDRRGPRGRLGLRLKLRPSEATGGRDAGLGGNAIVEYDWRMAVGDVELSEAEFRQLAELKVPLVQIRGEWVELRPDKIEQAITFWEKQARSAELSAEEALPLALGTEEVGGLPVLEVDAEGWVADLLGRANGEATLAPLDTPHTFVGRLRPYQERGAGWLTFLADCGLGACLADDMGLGKTPQYIAFLLNRRERGPRTPSLLVCPTSVVGNWRHELERFAPGLRVYVHHGSGRRGGAEFAAAAAEHDLVVTSYALVHRDRETLSGVEWDGVVLDEAQNVKNPATLQARAVRALPSRYRFALTGTPIENRLMELWSIVDFLNPGYLGSQRGFRERFVTPIERWQDPERSEQLRRLVQPLILRRVKSDPTIIQDLPEKLEMKVFCTLTAEQATLYQAVVSDMLAKIEASDGIQRRGLVLATLTRLKQVCNHPAHFLGDGSALPGRSGKLDRLQEMLEEALAEGDRALVFTQFAEFGTRLREHLQAKFGREVLFLHGGVPAEQRDAMVARFQQDSDAPPIFVLSLRAGGVGLNLTRASHVFHFDRWWNPAVEDQATDRAFRIGQRRNVQVHKFVCAGTLEEKIDTLIESKKALAEQVIGSGESWLTELSTADLRELLALRAGAVVE